MKFTCQICFDENECINIYECKKCTFQYCKKCINIYIMTNINQLNHYNLELSCLCLTKKLDHYFIKIHYLTFDNYQKYYEKYIFINNIFICLYCNNECKTNKCKICKYYNCLICKKLVSVFHFHIFKKTIKNINNELLNIKYIKNNKTKIKKCPKCKMGIEKISGCDHMKCTKCQTRFNWLNLKIE